MTNDKKLGKYLYFSKLRQENLKSYFIESKNYTRKDFSNLYNNESNESDHLYILGLLISNDIKKIGNKDIIELSKNESQFRNLLSKTTSKKINEIFEKYNIESENILETSSNEDPKKFNPYRFIELIIEKQDKNIINLLKRKKEISKEDLKEYL